MKRLFKDEVGLNLEDKVLGPLSLLARGPIFKSVGSGLLSAGMSGCCLDLPCTHPCSHDDLLLLAD